MTGEANYNHTKDFPSEYKLINNLFQKQKIEVKNV